MRQDVIDVIKRVCRTVTWPIWPIISGFQRISMAYATAVFDVTNHQTVKRRMSHADSGLRSLGPKPSHLSSAPSPPREQRSRIRRKFTSRGSVVAGGPY